MISFFRYLLIFVFGLFFTRCLDLMLVKGGYFRRLAEENRIRRTAILPARGKILDCNGQELARNNVFYFDKEGKKIEREKALNLQSAGAELRKKWVREYPFSEITASVVGYLTEANEDEINNNKSECPVSLGSLVGRGGVEQFYDCLLRGQLGEELVETGVSGETIRQLGVKEAQAGGDLNLTIDINWQKAAYEALSGKRGAAAVLNPENGEVLALVSMPTYDPNAFTVSRNEAKIKNYLESDDLPFLNRVISGAYHPGSVFKMVPAIAGLEEKKIKAGTEIEDVGEIKIGEWRFGNWYWLEYGQKEGMVNLVKAIKRSNDIYFYKIGELVGIDSMLDWSRKFGFGQKTGIDLPNEVAGFLPSPEWKEKEMGERWFLGNTYHFAIGQGDLTATPLQIALETAVVANGGKMCKPHLLNPKQENICWDLGIKSENISLVKQGMIGACSEGGTGFPFFDFIPQVACKTGTAEVGNIDKDAHAWFTLFYPTDNPEVVITVLVERGGSGAYVAAPIAKEIIERYRGEFTY